MSNDAWNIEAKVVNKLCPSCTEACKQAEFVKVVNCKYYRKDNGKSKVRTIVPVEAP